MAKLKSVDAPTYGKSEDDIVAQAIEILERRVRNGKPVTDSEDVPKLLRLQFGTLDYEVFSVMYLDASHRLIKHEQMFRGTLTQTSVYPREVVKAALWYGTAAVVLVHNHPSGINEPSEADKRLTESLRAALAMVDVRVLDHIVVSCSGHKSFAEMGLL